MISFSHDQQAINGLKWTNSASEQFRYVPDSLLITLDLSHWRRNFPEVDAARIDLPFSWVTERPTWRPVTEFDHSIRWIVTPREMPRTCQIAVTCTGFVQGRPVACEERSIPVEIVAVSRFDPGTDGIATPNSVDGWGVVVPDRRIFDQTYSLALFKRFFFNGLYRSVVFLGDGTGSYQGGICTGMARVALEQSLNPGHDPSNLADILIWHGRQLCDRALLAASFWLFVPSPKRVYQTFRRELVEDRTVRRCFDIGVPRPWRADLFDALKQEGHTVVPYALVQSSDDRAIVSVYDPNDPAASARGERSILFDLRRNTYEYSGIASADDRRTTIIAVEQRAYREGRTAMLASCASLIASAGSAASHAVRRGLASLRAGVSDRRFRNGERTSTRRAVL